MLTDLDSANGTTLRQQPLAGRAALESGDEICLADEVTFLYEVRPDVPWVLMSAAGAIVVGVVIALLVLSARDPVATRRGVCPQSGRSGFWDRVGAQRRSGYDKQ